MSHFSSAVRSQVVQALRAQTSVADIVHRFGVSESIVYRIRLAAFGPKEPKQRDSLTNSRQSVDAILPALEQIRGIQNFAQYRGAQLRLMAEGRKVG